MNPIYPRGPVTPTHDEAGEPSTPVDPLNLSEYVEVCRALIRNGGDSPRRIEEVLAAHGLTQDRWALISADWTSRIRRDPDIRSAFQRLYVGVPVERADGNE
jgi:hypothetical protein